MPRLRSALVLAALGVLGAYHPTVVPGQHVVPLAPPADGFVVIVNAANTVRRVPRDQLTRVYLKKSSRWSTGTPAAPVDLPADSPVRASFSKRVLGRSVPAVKAYWQQRIFSGRDVPPPEKASEAEAVAFVRTNPAAVAYVSHRTPLGAGVRILTVTE